jgi:hypothetical protein
MMRSLISWARDRKFNGDGWWSLGRSSGGFWEKIRSRSGTVETVKPFVDVLLEFYGRKRSSGFILRQRERNYSSNSLPALNIIGL